MINSLNPAQEDALRAWHETWYRHGVCTDPADRPTAEAAIARMYALLGKPAPQFVWVDSPATANLAIWLLSGRVGDSLGDSLRDSLRVTYTPFWGGQDAYWIAYYTFARDILGVPYTPDRSMQLDLWADIVRSAGWWWPYDRIVVISERPSAVRMERVVRDFPWGTSAMRLHCPDGPALAYRDGWTVHAWHGTRVPADMIEGSGWSTDRILREENAEIRRCAIERMGWDEFVRAAQLRQVGEAVPDPGNPGHDLTLWDVPERIYGSGCR